MTPSRRHRHPHLLLAAVALLLAAGCEGTDRGAPAEEPEQPSLPPELAAPSGDWIREDYATRLEETRDPQRALTAVDPSEPVVLRIVPGDTGQAWLAVLNFHEGVWARVDSLTTEPGGASRRVVFSRPFETPLLAGEHRLLPGGEAGRIRWAVREGERERSWLMRRAEPTVERWASALILGGSYSDAAGRSLEFGDDGRLIWSGREYQYRVHLDMVGVGCPYFEAEPLDNASSAVMFGFERSGDQLHLYDAGSADDPSIQCTGTPLQVLTPR